jgi:colanic acid/amylovoran biosynthesis protein
MSHSNGFDLPPYFKLKHGRDYLLAKRLYEIIKNRNKIDLQKLKLQNIVLDAWTVKAFIGKLDILISGRIHGAVAGLSQYIPTLIIDYGHEPKAHKLKGFAQLTGMESMIVDPNTTEQLLLKFNYIYNNTEKIKKELKLRIPELKQLAKENFKLLKYL